MTSTKPNGPAFTAAEHRPIASLTPYKRNARLHDRAQLDDLKRSMVKFGWTMPVLADEKGGLIAGHARLIAAAELGYTDAPVITATGWSEAQKKAYVLADNKLTERGGWDWEIVSAELAELRDMDWDLALTGFEEHELEPLLRADWRVKGDPDEKAAHDATDGHKISVTLEQYEVIDRAITKERERAGTPRMSEGAALERIARGMLDD